MSSGTGAWLKASGSRGIRKHQGTLNVAKRRLSTRNRSKVERLREYLNDLHLEEIETAATGRKACGKVPRLQVELRDIQVQEGSSSAGILVRNDDDPIVGANPIIKRKAGGKHRKIRSALKTVNFDSSVPSEDKKSPTSGICFQTNKHALISKGALDEVYPSDISQSSSCTGKGDKFLSSLSSSHMRRPKRKSDRTIKHAFVPLIDFNGTRDQNVGNDSNRTLDINDNDNVDSDISCDNDDDNLMDRDEFSLSPPNSPLYDMPPPSTPAQKKTRREKRSIQLERWRKYEASKSRQERYQRRMQESAKTVHQNDLAQDSKRVKWSVNLVQTVYIDDKKQ